MCFQIIPKPDEIPTDVILDIAWDVPKVHKFIGASGFMSDRVRIDVSDSGTDGTYICTRLKEGVATISNSS